MIPFETILDQYPRIGIAGGPRTGKTTLSERAKARRTVIGTDAYKDLEWSEVPHRMIADVGDADMFLIEGVQVGRALRKGLKVDALVYLTDPVVEQSPGQAAMAKGIHTILSDWSANYGPHDVPVFLRRGDGFEQVPASVIPQLIEA